MISVSVVYWRGGKIRLWPLYKGEDAALCGLLEGGQTLEESG